MRLGRTRPVCFALGEDDLRIFHGEEETHFQWPTADSPEAVDLLVQEVRPCLDGPRRPRVSLLLLPPLVDVRRVILPALKPREITAVLENHGSRYFPRPMAEAAIGWMALENGAEERVVLAAAADEAPLALLLEALRRAGHPVVRPVPAHTAWLLAAKRKADFRAHAEGSICIDLGHAVLSLGVRHGRVVSTPTFAREGLPGLIDRLRTQLRNGEPVVILGDGALADHLADDLRVGTPSEQMRIDDDPVRIAARFSDGCSEPVVLPARIRDQRATRRRRAEIGRWLTAGVLLLAAAGVDSWRLSRDLRDVRAMRADHADEVEEVLLVRDRIGAVDDWVDAAHAHLQDEVDWDLWLVAIIGALPPGAQLDQIAGREDEVEISGSAPSAADVLAAVRAVPGVVAVDPLQPVRRVRGPADSAEDQFSLAVRLSRESLP